MFKIKLEFKLFLYLQEKNIFLMQNTVEKLRPFENYKKKIYKNIISIKFDIPNFIVFLSILYFTKNLN